MKVTVEPLTERITEKPGIFRTKKIVEQGSFLRIDFEFTSEERAVLDKHRGWEHVLYEVPNTNFESELEYNNMLWADYERDKTSHIEMQRWTAKPPSQPAPSKTIKITIADYCKSRTAKFLSEAGAKNYTSDMQLKYLPMIKEILDFNKTPAQKQTFNL